jgi:hypothetical protein
MPSATATVKQARRGHAVIVEPPAPSLRRLDSRVKVTETEDAKKKDEIPIVQIEGDTCKRFNEAKKAMKDAEAVIKELQPVIHQKAMERIFDHNCAPDCLKMLTSVKLQDLEPDPEDPEDEEKRVPGEVTRVSFTSRYNNCDAELVDATFADFKGRDINDYVVETIAAKFDDSVFLDADGNFNVAIYRKFVAAIDKVAKEVGLKASPLSCKRVLETKPDFHERRFKDFDAEENFTLAKILPNTIQCAPARTV